MIWKNEKTNNYKAQISPKQSLVHLEQDDSTFPARKLVTLSLGNQKTLRMYFYTTSCNVGFFFPCATSPVCRSQLLNLWLNTHLFIDSARKESATWVTFSSCADVFAALTSSPKCNRCLLGFLLWLFFFNYCIIYVYEDIEWNGALSLSRQKSYLKCCKLFFILCGNEHRPNKVIFSMFQMKKTLRDSFRFFQECAVSFSYMLKIRKIPFIIDTLVLTSFVREKMENFLPCFG